MRGLLRRRAKGSFRDMTLLRAVGLAVVVAAAGCASSPVAGEPTDGTYVGAVQGSDAWITVVVRGNDAAVYACGGAASFSTVSRWYVGTRAGQAVTVSKDGWTATATVSGGHAVGKLTPPTGAPLAFDVGRAHANTLDGLYAVTDQGKRTGVIVRQDPGGSPAVQGAWFGPTLDAVAQVTPILPVAKSGFDVEFVSGGQTRRLTVVPFAF